MNKYITPLTANEVLALAEGLPESREQIYPGISAGKPTRIVTLLFYGFRKFLGALLYP